MPKKSILLLHGYDANGSSHFLPDLKEELLVYGNVYTPSLPDSKFPKVDNWKKTILKITKRKKFDLAVGHSLGGVILMRMIAEEEIQVKNLITIASSPGWKDIAQLNDFITPPIPFDKLHKRLTKFIVVHSFDDPYCAFEYGMILVKQAGAAGLFYNGFGHFLVKKLPSELINIMRNLLR